MAITAVTETIGVVVILVCDMARGLLRQSLSFGTDVASKPSRVMSSLYSLVQVKLLAVVGFSRWSSSFSIDVDMVDDDNDCDTQCFSCVCEAPCKELDSSRKDERSKNSFFSNWVRVE